MMMMMYALCFNRYHTHSLYLQCGIWSFWKVAHMWSTRSDRLLHQWKKIHGIVIKCLQTLDLLKNVLFKLKLQDDTICIFDQIVISSSLTCITSLPFIYV